MVDKIERKDDPQEEATAEPCGEKPDEETPGAEELTDVDESDIEAEEAEMNAALEDFENEVNVILTGSTNTTFTARRKIARSGRKTSKTARNGASTPTRRPPKE